MENSPLLTVQEVIDLLRISRSKLVRLRKDGEIVAQKMGRSVRVDPKEIEAYLRRTKETHTEEE